VWVLTAACGGGRPPPTTSAPTPTPGPATAAPAADSPCRAAVDHLFAVTSAQEEPKVRDLASKVFVHRCDADRWSDEIRQCLLDVKAPPDADRCEKLLTPPQQQELRNELAHELDAAGVPPQRASGKSDPK
jgi:hypothetical protein